MMTLRGIGRFRRHVKHDLHFFDKFVETSERDLGESRAEGRRGVNPQLLQLLHDARDLIHNLGLGEYGYMDPSARAMIARVDEAIQSAQGETSSRNDAGSPKNDPV